MAPSSDSAAAEPAARTYSPGEIRIVISGVLLGMFLAALDQTIVATALPAIGGELKALDRVSWLVSAYLLTSTASTPIYGKLSDLYGRRVVMQAALGLFVLASLLCGLAQGMTELILARALQGLGGGGLMSLAQTTVADVVSPRERGRYQGYFIVNWALASVGGPVVGGLFVDYLDWRWVFWINLPIGLIALLLCNLALRTLPVRKLKRPIDYGGALLLTGSVTTLLLVASWGGTELAWSSPELILLAAAGGVLALLLVLQELRAPEPMIPPRLFRSRQFRRTQLLNVLMAMAYLDLVVYLPLFLQLVLGMSAGGSGLLIVPLVFGTAIGAVSSGQITTHTGRYKWIAISGMALALVASLLIAGLGRGSSDSNAILIFALFGLGIGAVMPVTLVAVQNAAPPGDIGAGTSSIAFFRSLGASFSIALLGSVLIAAVNSRLAGGAAPVDMAFLRGGAAAIATLPESSRESLVAALETAFFPLFAINAAIVACGLVAALALPEVPLRSGAVRKPGTAAAD
jgi:EmrB/QacA subfamily drug resistance transporter